ncbi:MAG: HAMP domain-containing histidine kinase [Candidatus Magnetoovum sp. WYHC-5]|nr:HAMP domain-containing histidine kinase [Candidatus Magnetoovum sp. WYHC-5]
MKNESRCLWQKGYRFIYKTHKDVINDNDMDEAFGIIIFDCTDLVDKSALDDLKDYKAKFPETLIILFVGSLEFEKHICNGYANSVDLVFKGVFNCEYLQEYLEKSELIGQLKEQIEKDRGIFRSILDKFSIPVTLIDHAYRVLYVNDAQRRLTQDVCYGERCFISMAAGLSRGMTPCAPCAITNTFLTGENETITRWGTKKDGTPWHSLQRSAAIEIDGRVVAAIKTVEDRSDILKRFEAEKTPMVRLKRRIDEIFKYMIQLGFEAGIFYEIKTVPEGGFIFEPIMWRSFGCLDKHIKGVEVSIIVRYDDMAMERIFSYRRLSGSKDKLIYGIVPGGESFYFGTNSVLCRDSLCFVEVPLLLKERVVGILVFAKKIRLNDLSIATSNDFTCSFDSINENVLDEHMPFLVNYLSYLQTVWIGMQQKATTIEDRYLLALTEELASLSAEDGFYELFLKKVVEFLGFVEGLIMSYDESRGVLFKRAWTGPHTAFWSDFTAEDCLFPCCLTSRKRKRTLLQDYQNSELKAQVKQFMDTDVGMTFKSIEQMKGWLDEIGSWVCFPMIVPVETGRTFLGTVSFQSTERFFFTEERIAFIERAISIACLVLTRLQAEEATKMAAAANAQLQIALRTVHNLRTPSTAARNYLEVLADWIEGRRTFNAEPLSDRNEASQILDKALTQLQRIERLASDIQTLLKPLKLRSSRTNLISLIRDTVDTLIKPMVVPIEVAYAFDDEHIYINADVDSIKEVFEQFVENANRAMERAKERKLKITVQYANYMTLSAIEVPLNLNRKYVIVYFSDTGVGMPQEIQGRIFDPWVSASPSSTGLGLAITKKIIEEHEGKIWLDKSDEEGTSFGLVLLDAEG